MTGESLQVSEVTVTGNNRYFARVQKQIVDCTHYIRTNQQSAEFNSNSNQIYLTMRIKDFRIT